MRPGGRRELNVVANAGGDGEVRLTFQESSAKPSNIFIQKSSLPCVPDCGVDHVDGLDEGVVVVAGIGIGVSGLSGEGVRDPVLEVRRGVDSP